MPRYQHARVLRTAVAVAALVAAVGGEAVVGRALAHRGAEQTGRPALARAALVRDGESLERAGRGGAGGLVRAVLVGRPISGSAAPALPGARPELPKIPGAALLRTLPARLDRDGVAIDVGRTRAPVTVTLYEDYRCPDCRRFEAAQGETLARLAADGTVRLRYVIECSLDERLPGDGAHRAANAARAALAVGGFPLYNALLYRNQPPERQDGFTVDRLLRIASDVPGLRGRTFDEAVRSEQYADWVDDAQDAYDRYADGFKAGTPGLVVNGKAVDLVAHPELAEKPAALRTFLLKAARG
ncbi:thioredoxin domain-containing protein [Streptomyces sp. NPDC092296]|uniref:DsbA family protein n=1 Tax=Streptomyces sp. NPDC092296 TaxID=3366012 RepID=UPI00382E44CC